MYTLAKLTLPLAALATLSACEASAVAETEADPIEEVSAEDPAMNAAKAEAQETLPEWLAVLGDPPSGTSGVSFKSARRVGAHLGR